MRLVRNPAARSVLLAVVAIAGLPGAARAGVIVVDWNGNGDFTLLQPAIDAAAEGDTILVRAPGAVDDIGVVIDGKSLTIVGDVPVGSGTRLYAQYLLVRNLQAGQQVVARNFRFVSPAMNYPGGFLLLDNAGSVWIEDCDATGTNGNSSAPWGCGTVSDTPGAPGIRAQNCSAITVVNCTVTGGPGSDAFDFFPIHFAGLATDGGPALRAQDSLVAVYRSVLTGGKGGAGHLCTETADGGLGVDVLSSSMLFLSGCTVTGGMPGAGPPVGAPGGGLHSDAGSTAELLDTTIAAAPGGVDVDAPPGALTTYPGVTRLFALTSPMREGQAGTLTIQGVQGDFVGFFWAFDNGMLPMPSRNGWFLLNAPFVAGPFLIGAISSPSGTWQLPITAPALGPAMQAQTFLLQAYFVHAGGGATLGSGTAFTLVDATL